MDMITLAMAKKYTDEKVASGGGSSSGGGLPVVELTTVPSADAAALTVEETAQVVKAIATGGVALVFIDSLASLPMICRVCEYEDLMILQGKLLVYVSDGGLTAIDVWDIWLGVEDGAGFALKLEDT